MPGRGSFEVPFAGQKLTWTLNSNESDKKTAIATEASSTSNRCASTSTAAPGSAGVEKDKETITTPDTRVYPNPTSGKLWVTSSQKELKKGDVELYDMQGRQYNITVMQEAPYRSVLNIAGLPAGTYIVKVRSGQEFKLFRIIKN